MRQLRSVLVITAIATICVACGGGGTPSPSSAASAGASTGGGGGASTEPGTSPDASAEPSSGGGGGGGGGSSDIPDIADGPWGAGTATVEITGGATVTIEGAMPDGLGYTLQGLTTFIFTNAEGTGVINVTLSNDEQTGFGVSSTAPVVTTAGTWGVEGCGIDITKSDDSGIEATFGCDGIPALSGGTTAVTIDLDGEFSVAR